MLFSNGNQYIGDFLDNKRSGKGKLIIKNGDIYDGDWLDDKIQGIG